MLLKNVVNFGNFFPIKGKMLSHFLRDSFIILLIKLPTLCIENLDLGKCTSYNHPKHTYTKAACFISNESLSFATLVILEFLFRTSAIIHRVRLAILC